MAIRTEKYDLKYDSCDLKRSKIWPNNMRHIFGNWLTNSRKRSRSTKRKSTSLLIKKLNVFLNLKQSNVVSYH